MSEKIDRRIRKTKAQLRAGLARLMEKKSIKEITVKELVEEVDINRSTFYLHYTDIYQMLESIENELMEEVSHAIEENPVNTEDESCHYLLAEQLLTILDNHKDICVALLGSNGDMVFVERMEKLIAETVFRQLNYRFSLHEHPDTPYIYAFCLKGCVGMIKTWLCAEQQQSVKHMAELLHRLVANTAKLTL